MPAAAAMSQTPVIPPRPTRSADKESSDAPKVPPRPAGRRKDRSLSPEGRFAPSPLKEGFKSPKSIRFSPNAEVTEYTDEPFERSRSVSIPNIGEEGNEYAAMEEEMKKDMETRTVGEDVKLHAPKPSLPAHSAKQRIATVTHTDSNKAASYGIGRPTSAEFSKSSLKKKSSTSQLSSDGRDVEDEQGIPTIGQRVPMNPNAGDIQAPSPAPVGPDGKPRHHIRKGSARDLPPGSYGMHGHGIISTDKLDKAYYEKHPEALHQEYNKYHDRQNDFALSSKDLNKLVRDTRSHGSGLGTSSEFHGTPSEEVGFQAHDYASRPSSTVPTQDMASPQISISRPEGEEEEKATIHLEDPRRRPSISPAEGLADEDEDNYTAPILAEDEVAKDPEQYDQQAAVEPPPERRGSAYEMEEARSRPTSRPTSMYNNNAAQDFGSTPLEDVQEYEPLFDDDGKEIGKKEVVLPEKAAPRHKFPSKDVWEDAPSSVHYTAEVTTPDVDEGQAKSYMEKRNETPAEAFARHQEELAEKEARGTKFVPRGEKSAWVALQPNVDEEKKPTSRRFPSKDVWEDAPESHMHETTVSGPQEAADVPTRSKPAIPERPKPKTSGDDKPKPAVSDKPKPQIPVRPSKSSAEASDEAGKKPAVPTRPLGGKIAALQAGFMSDLNKRLQLGPQAPKKEEPPAEEEVEEKEKAPLSDARKGRARGPQRRAPGKSPSPAVSAGSSRAAEPAGPSLSFVIPQTVWTIDPEGNNITVDEADETEAEAQSAPATRTVDEPVAEAEVEKEGGNLEDAKTEEATKE